MHKDKCTHARTLMSWDAREGDKLRADAKDKGGLRRRVHRRGIKNRKKYRLLHARIFHVKTDGKAFSEEKNACIALDDAPSLCLVETGMRGATVTYTDVKRLAPGWHAQCTSHMLHRKVIAIQAWGMFCILGNILEDPFKPSQINPPRPTQNHIDPRHLHTDPRPTTQNHANPH